MEKQVTVLQNSSRLMLVKLVQHSLEDQTHTSRCYGNLPQVMSIKRKVKRQGDPLQRQHRGTELDILKHNFKFETSPAGTRGPDSNSRPLDSLTYCSLLV